MAHKCGLCLYPLITRNSIIFTVPGKALIVFFSHFVGSLPKGQTVAVAFTNTAAELVHSLEPYSIFKKATQFSSQWAKLEVMPVRTKPK